ncbi:hypothetical protein PYW08_000583 [Mythimna loreyi]|uniref:Uncharacterized protein n=1 Tax=Mythimna loreyi TaxID=667449 RepID=A0ACC2RCV3_9NEOP|nr:hypothetical protein PYW08_000583 [Mythimna loreyi]
MSSDASEASLSQKSYASERSVKSCRGRPRKRTQVPRCDDLTEKTKKKAGKSVALSKPITDEAKEGTDSELASPPPKQAKTKSSGQQDIPELEMLAKKMQAQPTAELSTCIIDSLRAIEEVANGSRNLKTSFTYSLKLAAVTVQAAVAELVTRSAVEVNVERLECENADLKARLTSLSAQVENLTAQVSLLSRKGELTSMVSSTVAASPLGHSQTTSVAQILGRSDESEALFRRSIALEIGGMVDAKLAALERRLPPEKPLRPPLAADTKKVSSSVAQVQTIAESCPVPNPTKKNGRKKGKRKVVDPVVDLPAVPAAPPLTSQALLNDARNESETWSSVVGRKAKNAKTPQPIAQTSGQNKNQTIKLPRLPTTAAITVSIREGSSAKLGEVMHALRQQIRLADLGIDTVGQRRAADGGIIITVAGPESSHKADSLASRMREVFNDSDVKISRPTKRAEARILDLDDAVTPDEVAAALAMVGGCSNEDVKVGEIRRPPASLGHVWVRAPLATIKKLASDKYIRLGWTSARAQVLGARRMMCFRCLEPGHVRRLCTSSIDRSTQCYACGGAHKARECTATIMRCPLCSDQGLPADHRLGGKKCIPRKKRASHVPVISQKSAPAPMSTGPAVDMDTSPSQP